MKQTIFLILSILVYTNTYAQDHSEKMFSDFSKAKVYAQENDKAILMVFAGSDWCKPCIQFKRSILTNDKFQEYANSNLVILYLDFPLKKVNKLPEAQTKQNELLAERYNSSGVFPKILLLNAHEEQLGVLEFKNQSPQDFIEECKNVLL